MTLQYFGTTFVCRRAVRVLGHRPVADPLHRLHRTPLLLCSLSTTSRASRRDGPAATVPRLPASFFLSRSPLNASFEFTTAQRSDVEPASPSQASPDLPHRRRQAERRKRKESEITESSQATADNGAPLPPDASAVLSNIAAQHPAHSSRRRTSALLSLAKPRLTILVVLTAMTSYALYPVPSFLSPTMTEAPSLSPLTLLFLTTGTMLCSASANSLNMLYERSTDAIMTRTRNRPIVRGLVSRPTALLFATLAAASGIGALYFGVNPTVAFLGATNIFLYAGMYTPLKAFTAANTWIGALVGGIPPLMGWAAAAGESATNDGSWRELLLAPDGSSIGGWLLATLLFAWQFPHFMALSYTIREDYKAAGLRMLAWTNPARNARVALRYSLLFIPLSLALCASGVTEWSFAITSMPVNGWLAWRAVQFWRFEGGKGTARGLFWASVWHLPVIMVLSLLQKKGMWRRVWQSIVGEEEEEYWEDELPEMGNNLATGSK